MLYFTYLGRSPHWTNLNLNLHGSCRFRQNHVCKVSTWNSRRYVTLRGGDDAAQWTCLLITAWNIIKHVILCVALTLRLPDVVGSAFSFRLPVLWFYLIPSLFCRQLISDFNERNSTKRCHVFGGECDLKICVQNLGHSSPKITAQKLLIFDVFAT